MPVHLTEIPCLPCIYSPANPRLFTRQQFLPVYSTSISCHVTRQQFLACLIEINFYLAINLTTSIVLDCSLNNNSVLAHFDRIPCLFIQQQFLACSPIRNSLLVIVGLKLMLGVIMLVKVWPPLLNCSQGRMLHVRRGPKRYHMLGWYLLPFPSPPYCEKFQSLLLLDY